MVPKEKLIDEIAAKEEQCYQMSEFVEQLTNLLHESQAELEDKVEVIKALELRLKLGKRYKPKSILILTHS